MIRLLLTSALILLGSLVVAQDCPLPTTGDIVSALNQLLFDSDGSQTYNSNITGSVHYVCQAQGSVRDTYQHVSIIATYTPNTGQPQATSIFQLSCITAPTWSPDTSGGLDNPAASVINGNTRTNCFDCNHNFGDDRCRACGSQCASGLGRCVGNPGTCCTVFLSNGQCSTNCSSDGINYAATMSNDYACACNLTCSPGYTANSNCTNCTFTNICLRDTPCQNGGVCKLSVAPDQYSCNCTRSAYTGANCTVCPLSCGDGRAPNDDCTGCVLTNICLANNPCKNGGSCTLGLSPRDYTCNCVNNFSGNNCTVCSLNCQNSGNVTSDCTTCICPVGYTGTRCDTMIDYCRDTPCGVYGTCSNHHLTGGYSCTCRSGWTGDHCQDCDLKYCTRCTGTPPTCTQCSDGYVIAGSTCELRDLCHLQPCHNNGTCIGAPGSFMCQCADKWTQSSNCSRCEDGYGLRNNHCVSCSKNCLLCAESIDNCTRCDADYTISRGQCVSTSIPNSLLIWIIIGSVIGGLIVLAAVCFIVMAFVRCSSSYNDRMAHRRTNRDAYKAGNKVSSNPLYLSKDDLMKGKEEEEEEEEEAYTY